MKALEKKLNRMKKLNNQFYQPLATEEDNSRLWWGLKKNGLNDCESTS